MPSLSLKRTKKKEKSLTFSEVGETMVNNSKLLSVTTDTLSNKIPKTVENVVLNPTKFVGLKLSEMLDYIFCMIFSCLLSYYFFHVNK